MAYSVFWLSACERHPALASSLRALQRVHLLRIAENTYQIEHGHYGDLLSLGPSGAGLVDSALSSGKVDGYEFQIEVSEIGYKLTAWPLDYGKSGFGSFYCDQTGVIRRSWGHERATAESSPAT